MTDFEYGKHINFPYNLNLEDDITSVTKKFAVMMQEKIDDAITSEIVRAAKEKGITDVYILDKQNIISALLKQIPKKAVNDGTQFAICPECGASVNKDIEQVYNCETSYCVCCGQALDWSDYQTEKGGAE